MGSAGLNKTLKFPSKKDIFQGSPFRDSIGDLLVDTLSYQVKSVKSSEKLLWEMYVSLFVVWESTESSESLF